MNVFWWLNLESHLGNYCLKFAQLCVLAFNKLPLQSSCFDPWNTVLPATWSGSDCQCFFTQPGFPTADKSYFWAATVWFPAKFTKASTLALPGSTWNLLDCGKVRFSLWESSVWHNVTDAEKHKGHADDRANFEQKYSVNQ